MRLAIVNCSNRKIGGTEHYLEVLLQRLHARGVELLFVHENSQPSDREALPIPSGVTTLCVENLGKGPTIEAIRQWHPEMIFAHGELDPSFEARYLALAPSIYFSHNYYGTCITGLKTFQNPEIRPCQRRFGLQCLVMYFPRQCGGMNPMTMVTRYRQSARRLRILRRYDALVTHSQYLQREYLNHGFAQDRVHNLKYEVSTKSGEMMRTNRRAEAIKGTPPDVWRMIFAGRMERVKGGPTLIEALPVVQREIRRPLHLALAGDGPDRPHWEQMAGRVMAANPEITIQFHGWLKGDGFDRLFATTHLVVVPSLWPEPFGKAGLEAGLHGIPSAAFDVGGIGEWLQDGVNGHLADGDPPTSAGIARAITACLCDPNHYQRLTEGARRIAVEFNLDNHIDQLMMVFREVGDRVERSRKSTHNAMARGIEESSRLPATPPIP